MTERVLIPCPICHGSTKEVQGVLACIANCRTQFYGLAKDKWYVGVQEDLDKANAQIVSLKTRLEQVSNLHLFSLMKPGTKIVSPDVTDDMARAYFGTREAAQDAWKAMWAEADDDLYVNPVTNTLLKRCIEIAWERGFGKAVNSTFVHNAERTIPAIELGAVIHIAFEELQREKPELFKDYVPEQFSE